MHRNVYWQARILGRCSHRLSTRVNTLGRECVRQVGERESSWSGTMSRENSLVCRICQSTEGLRTPLLSGEVAHTVPGRDYCGLCGHQYPVSRNLPPPPPQSFCAGLRAWFTHDNVFCNLLLDFCMVLLWRETFPTPSRDF
ncbi:hypothetical protein PR048_014438 [Dryococelus australis]|uniref:Uncharacterized protein n=1 Tax=Dryococelus australis TaxID=614101 RepID=A0ABQ9HE81_9NEOP|nr:hypothetical protein PR048_014438 [Dryococelus australis]